MRIWNSGMRWRRVRRAACLKSFMRVRKERTRERRRGEAAAAAGDFCLRPTLREANFDLLFPLPSLQPPKDADQPPDQRQAQQAFQGPPRHQIGSQREGQRPPSRLRPYLVLGPLALGPPAERRRRQAGQAEPGAAAPGGQARTRRRGSEALCGQAGRPAHCGCRRAWRRARCEALREGAAQRPRRGAFRRARGRRERAAGRQRRVSPGEGVHSVPASFGAPLRKRAQGGGCPVRGVVRKGDRTSCADRSAPSSFFLPALPVSRPRSSSSSRRSATSTRSSTPARPPTMSSSSSRTRRTSQPGARRSSARSRRRACRRWLLSFRSVCQPSLLPTEHQLIRPRPHPVVPT